MILSSVLEIKADHSTLLDAIGRSVFLPLFLRSPGDIHKLLLIMCRDIPGRNKILNQEYAFTDEDSGFPVTQSFAVYHCPRCDVVFSGNKYRGRRLRCQNCQLTFQVFNKGWSYHCCALSWQDTASLSCLYWVLGNCGISITELMHKLLPDLEALVKPEIHGLIDTGVEIANVAVRNTSNIARERGWIGIVHLLVGFMLGSLV
ncbi:hypothetical protein WAI453_005567 [Rhynchosporium graminicola]